MHDHKDSDIARLEARVAELEARLEARDDRLDALLRGVPDYVLFKDCDRRYVDVSAAFAGLFGLQRSDLVGRRDEDLFPPQVAAIGKADDERVLSTGEPVIGRIETDGAELWVSTTKVPWRDADGRIVGLLGIARDVTTTKAWFDELQTEQARRARMEALGRLAGGIAHDFNNVLMVMVAAADEIGEALPAHHDAQFDVQLVREASRRASVLTRRLLSFSRSRPATIRPVVVAAVVTELRPLIDRIAKDGVDLAVRVSGTHRVLADPAEVEQVVLDLTINGRDAMPDGGDLHLSVDDADRDGRPGVRLTVRDTGVGFDAEALVHMFEPFASTRRIGVGPALGLATAKRVVTASGGHIDVDSEPGRGTCVSIWMPATEADVRVDGVPDAPPDLAPYTVLLVDDDDGVRAAVSRMIRRSGAEVLMAEDIEAAIAVVHDRQVDLLVTDVILKSSTGVVLAETLTARDPKLRVLYMSGFTNDVFAERGIDPASIELLHKPFTEAELWARLGALVGR